jgi:crotonobetainyl-CoA:carnitine CoA-transferase CaiB-like acyl-CoA transferase
MLLSSMKIVSFCHVLQGPAATQYLGDMGAEVIKIEPLTGELGRRVAGNNYFPAGISGFYLCAFRNKRLLAVDLKSPEGLEIVLSLIDRADAIVENYRAGVMDRLGLAYEALRERKPDIIYARGTGWGASGPMLDRTSQDLIIQAHSGMMRATGAGRATPVGAAVVDQHAGALLAMGVAAAYAKKLKTGEGTLVESSLFGAGIDLQAEPLTVYLSNMPGDRIHERDPHLATWFHEAPYGVYQVADAEVAVSSNDLGVLAEALNSDVLRSLTKIDRYKERDKYAKAFADVLSKRTFAEVSKAFDTHRIWYSKVNSYDDLARDPQAEALGAFREIDVLGERVTVVNHPIRYDGQIPEIREMGIRIGQHTRAILGELGFSSERIDGLIERKVVGSPADQAR